MKTLFRILSLVFLAAVFSYTIIVFAQQTQSSGNDVYNFYFQKAPGPQTVIQSGAQPAQVATPVPAAQPQLPAEGDSIVQQQTPAANTKAVAPASTSGAGSDFKKWEVSVGLASQDYFKSYVNEETKHFGNKNGLGVGGRYHFNRYIAAEAGLAYTPNISASSSNEKPQNQATLGNPELANMPLFNGYAGIKITPIHMDLFGHDLIELGASLGATTYALRDENYVENFQAISAQTVTKVGVYVAPTLGLNISKDFGAELSSKFLVDRKIENNKTNVATNLNVRWRF